MSELALQLIREAKEKHLTSLDLGKCGLTEIPEELFELTWLEELTLGKVWWNKGPETKISNIAPITALTNLKALVLINNNISDIKPISALTKLNSLDLSHNEISDIKPISALTKLNSLDLSGNEIGNIEPISALTKLNSLYLSYSEINNIKPISALTKLNSLDLRHSTISDCDIKPISALTKLNSLYLAGTDISDIEPIAALTNLNLLDLSYNKISDIEPISALTKLNLLELAGTGISDINHISALTNLKSLGLNDNQINDIKPLSALIEKGIPVKKERRYEQKEIAVGDNPLEHPPERIIEQGNEAILAYFRDLEEQGQEQLDEAKLIIVGEPGAGKTTLMEKLIAPSYNLPEETDEQSTLGINVREGKDGWLFPHPQKPEKQFTANIWDFGGQQIQYMTHQFFLTPGAVYVLVSANDRKETTANFPYWFKIIHLLGEEKGIYSPVLVVQNDKNGQFINQFDLSFYRKRYPELQIEVLDVNLSKTDAAFHAVRDKISTMLTSLPHVTDARPARWNDIRLSLRELGKDNDHITFQQYADVCASHTVTRESSQTLFSGYLHRLGSLLHFIDDPMLHDFIILNPQWAVDAVYSVLIDSNIARADGKFNQDKLFEIWKNHTHSERLKLLNLMKQDNFEICYPLHDDPTTFIAPQLLNDRRPFYEWHDQDTLKFRFQYKFMPEGIITRLIVRLNHLIAKNAEGIDLVWRNGVVLAENGTRAQILEEENRDGLNVIDITIIGNTNERKFLLRKIRDEVNALHNKWFKNIQSAEMIPCNCTYCSNPEHTDITFFEFEVLQRAQEHGKATVECNKEFLDVPVLGLLEGVFENDELKQQKREIEHHRSDGMKHETHIHNYVTPAVEPQATAEAQPIARPVTQEQEKLVDTQPKDEPLYKQWWVSGVIAFLLVGGSVFIWLCTRQNS